ncbi:MAG: glutamate 5-kinase [Deltaproteobacteria bacterium]|nr:glutamate 5-kinase [Deltaproteobacteria bacterium]
MERNELKKIKTVVVKVGTSILTDKKGALSTPLVKQVAGEIGLFHKKGIRVVLVSSGAIAAGMHELTLDKKPRELGELQACAAVGQPLLMELYHKLFASLKIKVGQILVTRDDLEHRNRFLNAKHTFNKLLSRKVLPIVNENDSVAVEEIKVGDNDTLAAYVASLVEADLLLILTDQDGFYTKDPSVHSDAKLIRLVQSIDRETEKKATGTLRKTSIGGMQTKIKAARRAAQNGIPTLIANGQQKGIAKQLLQGKNIGTLFQLRRADKRR